jgi:hypothetical protein
MRKQYYFRPSDRGYRAWDVDRLVALTRDFPRIQVALSDIRELDEAFPADEKGVVTWRNARRTHGPDRGGRCELSDYSGGQWAGDGWETPDRQGDAGGKDNH